MILELQRRLHESGRIRIGTSVPARSSQGKDFRRPVKLDHFLFTSSNKRILERVAELYGGQVDVWEEAPTTTPQWKVMTTADEVPVLVPPESMSLSQAYEHWDAGRCMRRCDGQTQTTGPECMCEPENRLCKPTTRLSLFLPQLLGSGLWRLDTHGYNAAEELQGAFGLAQILSQTTGKSVIPGMLGLSKREAKREGKDGKTMTHKFVVPVIEFDLGPALPVLVAGTSIRELAAMIGTLPTGDTPALAAGDTPAQRPALRPVPAEPQPTLAAELASVGQEAPKSRANGSEPLKRTGRAPQKRGGERPPAAAAAPATGAITEAQKRHLFRLLAANDIGDDQRHQYATVTLGREITSFNELTVVDANKLIDDLTRSQEGEPTEVPEQLAAFGGEPF